MKDIYIILTHTGTFLSRIIKMYTKKKYSHVSISIDKDISKMYSFGRLNPYNPFIGGFVEESVDTGTFKRFKNSKALIFSFQVTDSQYEQIKNDIQKFMDEKEKYKFNILGLFCTVINKKIIRKNYFYCAEFVEHIIEKQNIETNLPYIIRPCDFLRLPNAKFIYEGKLRDFYKKPRLIHAM